MVKFTKLEVELAEAINNLVFALDTEKQTTIDVSRAIAIDILDKNKMLMDHEDWHESIVVDETNKV